MLETAPPAAKPLSRAPAGSAAVSGFPASHVAGFSSVMLGLLESPTVKSDGAVMRPATRIGGPPVAPASNTTSPVIKDREKDEKTGKTTATSVRPTAPLQSVVPRAAVALALAQNGNTPNLGVQGELPAIPLRAGISALATTTQTQAAALANFPATSFPQTSKAAESLSPSGVPLGSSRDLAFALRLTWHSPASVTEAAGQPGSGASLPSAPSRSSATFTTTDPSSASGEIAANTVSEKPQVAMPISLPVGSQPTHERPTAGSTPSLLSWAAVATAGPDSALKKQAEFIAGNSLTKASSITTPASIKGPSASPFAKMPSSVETLPMRTEFESTETAGPSALVSAKAAGSGLPATPIQAQTKPYTPDDRAQTDQLNADQSDILQRLPVTSGTAPAAGLSTVVKDSESAQHRNAEQNDANDEGSSESGGKIQSVSLTEKPALPQGNHDRPSPSAGGVLLGQPQVPSTGPGTGAKVWAQPAQAPAVAPETEAAPAVAPPPLREVSLRLAVATSTATSNVDVQLAERAGRIQVAVRTSDQDLAKSLQGNLGDLVGRLEQKGFKTDVLTPALSQHSGSAVREPSTSSESQNQSAHSGSQRGQPDPRGRQQPDQQRQGRWKTEFEGTQLEETLATPNASQAGSGLTR